MNLELNILHEDPACLVVNKPAGLLTQAPLGIDSLEFRIKRYLKEQAAHGVDVYLGVPHRIDRPVSGVIVFAKTPRAARVISRQFERRQIEKTYWALVQGKVAPAEGTWTDHLKKVYGHPRAELVDEHDPEGRIAILHYRVITTLETAGTMLEIRLETGRTHQIRVQCAARGHALLGDELYGSQIPFGPPSDDERNRLIALHARSIQFRHPTSGDFLTFAAPLPDHWPSGPAQQGGLPTA